MNVKLNELIAAIPAEDSTEALADRGLLPVPVNSLHRSSIFSCWPAMMLNCLATVTTSAAPNSAASTLLSPRMRARAAAAIERMGRSMLRIGARPRQGLSPAQCRQRRSRDARSCAR